MTHLARALAGASLCLLVVAPACTRDGSTTAAPTRTLTAEPVSPTAATAPRPSPTSPSPSPSPSPTPTEPREPTDTDRARFVAGHRPSGTSDHRNVAIDLDGDGQQEIVFAYVVDAENRTQVDVADWRGTEYRISAQAPGGPAEELADLEVRDLNDDGTVDVAVFQTIGASGRSVTIWTAGPDGTLAGLSARGDCFDGRNTYGDSGAELADRDGDGADEVYATCQDEDLPAPLWPQVVYVWEDGAYRCDHREHPDGPDGPCEET